MKKSLVILLLLFFTIGVLSGCGTTATTAASDKKAEKTVVTVVSPYDLTAFEAGLKAAHPEIDLQMEKMSTGMINGEVAQRLRNGHGPDLIITNLPAGEVADHAYDLSASALVEKYQSSITKSIMIDGHSKYLPLPGGYYGYIINKTLLDQLGFELPETSEDLLTILAAAKEQSIGVMPETGYGLGLSDIGATFLGAYFTGDYATEFLSTAEGARWKAAFENNEASFAGAWEGCTDFISACIQNDYMDPDKLIVLYNGHMDSNANAFKAEEQLPAHTAILTFGNLETLEKVQGKTEDEITMLPCLPKMAEGNKLLSAVSNNYIAVNKALEAEEGKHGTALTVLDYLSTDEGQGYWIADSHCPHFYLNQYVSDMSALPESIRPYAEKGLVYVNPFPTNLISYMGKMLTSAAKGKTELHDALSAIDDYYLDGSDDVECDLSNVGTVSADVLYETPIPASGKRRSAISSRTRFGKPAARRWLWSTAEASVPACIRGM